LLATLQQKPSADKHGRAPDQKADVPLDPLVERNGFVDVVEAEQLVIDQTFNNIEDAEAHQECAGEELAGPADMVFLRVAPQHAKTNGSEDVRAGMEEPILEGLYPQVLDAVWSITRAGQHMVPLQALV
jgi:hypothetical protein